MSIPSRCLETLKESVKVAETLRALQLEIWKDKKDTKLRSSESDSNRMFIALYKQSVMQDIKLK